MSERNPNEGKAVEETEAAAELELILRQIGGEADARFSDTVIDFPVIDASRLDDEYVISPPAQNLGESDKHTTLSGHNPKIPDVATKVTPALAIKTDKTVLEALAPDFTLSPEYSAQELKPAASWQDPAPKSKANEKKTLFRRIFG